MAIVDELKLEMEKFKVWKNGNGAKGAELRIQENNTLAESARDRAAEAARIGQKANERVDTLRMHTDNQFDTFREEKDKDMEEVRKCHKEHIDWHEAETKAQKTRNNMLVGIVATQLIAYLVTTGIPKILSLVAG